VDIVEKLDQALTLFLVTDHRRSTRRSQVAEKESTLLEEPGLPRMYQCDDDFLNLCDPMRV